MKSRIEAIWVPQDLLKEICELATRAYPNETGGVLMGYDAGNGIVLTSVIGPGPRARHEPRAFRPDYEYQDAEIQRAYTSSRRCHTYLGDWHSHPHGAEALSWKDKRALRSVSSYQPARAPRPIMGILAGGNPWRLSVWRYHPLNLRGGRYISRYEQMETIRTERRRSSA